MYDFFPCTLSFGREALNKVCSTLISLYAGISRAFSLNTWCDETWAMLGFETNSVSSLHTGVPRLEENA